MSVDDGEDIADDIPIDLNDFVAKFEAWYKDDGERINPYDATAKFIDYYANKILYLPFARRELFLMYILNATFIGTFAIALGSIIALIITQLTGNLMVTISFIIAAFTCAIGHIIARLILRSMSRYESKVSVAVINYKAALTDAIVPNGQLADFINSITKFKPKIQSDDLDELCL